MEGVLSAFEQCDVVCFSHASLDMNVIVLTFHLNVFMILISRQKHGGNGGDDYEVEVAIKRMKRIKKAFVPDRLL